LLNSFDYYHPDSGITIHLLTPHADYLAEFRDRPGVKFIETEMVRGNNAWSTKIPRFKYAAELEGTVMVLDADMFFCANMELYFRVAEAGLIVAGANGSNFRFHEGWREKYDIDVPDGFHYKTITSVPTIMRLPEHKSIWRDIYIHKMADGFGADFDLNNIFLAVHGKVDDVVLLPSQQVTGIHHFMAKPNTRAIKKEGKMMSLDGLEIFTVHGKWWQENWVKNFRDKMSLFCEKRNDEVGAKEAQQSTDLLLAEFKKWSEM
jgi:hypothetical protein